VAQLLVRNIDDALARALKSRAAAHGRSAEAEHREILRAALATDPEGPSFKVFLLAMPDVGADEAFERSPDLPGEVEL